MKISSMTYAVSSTHKKLQKDYAMVYYDQRCSGMAQGNPKQETFTVEQYVEDLDKINQPRRRAAGVWLFR